MKSIVMVMLVLSLVLCSVAAFSAPSGLLQVPTADVLGAGQVQVKTVGAVPVSGTTMYQLDTQIGTGTCEFGIDTNFAKGTTTDVVGNVKFAVLPTIAVGVKDWALDKAGAVYAVTTQKISVFNITAGAIKPIEGKYSFMTGASLPLGEKLTVEGDYIAGNGNSSSVGVKTNIYKGFGVEAGALFPNDGGKSSYIFKVDNTIKF